MKRYSSHAGRPRRGAFTLIEMLVVVVILVIVITLIVNVGSYIRSSAQEKKVRSWETLIMTAVQAYYDKKHIYPNPALPNSPSADMQIAVKDHSKNLYDQLNALRESQAKLAGLPNDAIANEGGKPYFADPNGIAFDYSDTAGMGGGPVIISAGPDKLFPDPTNSDPAKRYPNAEDDNIRSDRQ